MTDTVSGIGVSLEIFNSSGTQINYYSAQNYDGDNTTGCNEASLVCTSDGIGIGDDETTYHDGSRGSIERIRVTFSEAIDVTAVMFLDFFSANAPSDSDTERAETRGH